MAHAELKGFMSSPKLEKNFFWDCIHDMHKKVNFIKRKKHNKEYTLRQSCQQHAKDAMRKMYIILRDEKRI